MRAPCVLAPGPPGREDKVASSSATIAHRHETETETIADRIERVRLDIADIQNFYKVRGQYLDDELQSLDESPFDDYDQDGKVDYLLLKSYLLQEQRVLKQEAEKDQKVLSFLGGYFPLRLTGMIQARQKVDSLDGKAMAGLLVQILEHISVVKKRIVGDHEKTDSTTAFRAVNTLTDLQADLHEFYSFYKDYDPLMTWWISDPYKKVDQALLDLRDTIKVKVLGITAEDDETIIGEPVGREGLLSALESEMIPYSPEELIGIGKQEYAWCEAEMSKAAAALGLQDWRDALEHVKNLYVAPGQQPNLVRDLTQEAASYVKKHDLVTVPKVCEETIQTFMMSPERQRMNPFFLGGDSIIVSYPTSTMSHDDKLMSQRGNNIHFSRATVFHEMIPGHHLQFYFMKRVRPYRQMFFTPFCTEGWAFYWEMVLWDKPTWEKTPENRIGMLFWRMHRCARIVFSLKYHLGEMTPQECIDLLVDWVGHERATAEGEVRRSIMGDYGPLYQAGYMLGALQLYSLREEVVDSGSMGEKQFHDAFLRANQMPVELFRALVKDQDLGRDFKSQWRFYAPHKRATALSKE